MGCQHCQGQGFPLGFMGIGAIISGLDFSKFFSLNPSNFACWCIGLSTSAVWIIKSILRAYWDNAHINDIPFHGFSALLTAHTPPGHRRSEQCVIAALLNCCASHTYVCLHRVAAVALPCSQPDHSTWNFPHLMMTWFSFKKILSLTCFFVCFFYVCGIFCSFTHRV